MAGNNGGPWGGGGGGNRGGGRGDDDDDRQNGSRRPGEQQQIPEIDEIVRKGQEQLRVLMGGRGGGNRGRGGDGGGGPGFTRNTLIIGVLAALALWGFQSAYRVDTSEQSVELLFGQYIQTRRQRYERGQY